MPESERKAQRKFKRASIILSVLILANGILFCLHGENAIRYTVLNVSNLFLEEKIDEFEYITGEGKTNFGTEYAIKAITPLLSEQHLKILTKDCYEYKITVNGKQIKDNKMEINANEKLIVTLEQIEHESLLPLEIKVKGSVTGGDKGDNFQSHLSIVTDLKYEEKLEKNKVTYLFDNLNSKDKITLIPSPILAESNFYNKFSVLAIFVT